MEWASYYCDRWRMIVLFFISLGTLFSFPIFFIFFFDIFFAHEKTNERQQKRMLWYVIFFTVGIFSFVVAVMLPSEKFVCGG